MNRFKPHFLICHLMLLFATEAYAKTEGGYILSCEPTQPGATTPNQIGPEQLEIRFVRFEYRTSLKKWEVFINDSSGFLEGTGENPIERWSTSVDVTDERLSLYHEGTTSKRDAKITDTAKVISLSINRYTGDYSFWSYEDLGSWTAPKKNASKGKCGSVKKKF